MEELQVIETTSGRQFKPWASREDVQAIEQAVEQAVQNPESVTAIASEIASGKQAIASAINAKGGTASATESFSELAQAVEKIPVNVQVEDAANLAFPESIAWNILKEAYAQQRVGYASWIVAEFFKGYDTIPLSGADAFYTCDGDFYTEATTHTWHDDSYNKVNRFVVYYFTGENVPFSVTQESVCPRSMAVMGKFGSINIASAGRIRQIYNGGEINDISFASTNPWCDEVLLGGVKEHNSGYLLYHNDNVKLFSSDIENQNGGTLVNIAAVTPPIITVQLPSLEVVGNGGIVIYTDRNVASFNSFSMPKLKTCDGTIFYMSGNTGFGGNFTNLTFPSLETIGSNGCLFSITGGSPHHNFANLRELSMPKLIQCGNKYSIFNYGVTTSYNNLIKIELGNGFNSELNLRQWYAVNAINANSTSLVDEGESFANNREKFLYNFEKYIVDKLADNSTTGLSYTITFYSAVYNLVSATQSITDKLTAKHWNLASANF